MLIAFAQVVQAGTKTSRDADTKTMDKSARVAALDYLGTIASRIRKDSLAASVDQNAVSDIVTMVC